MRKNPMAMANASGITAAIVYVGCRLFVQLFPDLSVTITRSWFHLLDVSKAGMDLSSQVFILGLVSIAISAWLIGYVFAVIYNMFVKGKR